MSVKGSPVFHLLFFLLLIIFIFKIGATENGVNLYKLDDSQRGIDIINRILNAKIRNYIFKSKDLDLQPTHTLERRNLRRYGCRFKFCRIIEPS
uniref:Uncharacterized protein n=1 Tax=Parastrongyloides trichosuri TaxID=131310 RepID=A0A0N4ZBU4_PARTI